MNTQTSRYFCNGISKGMENKVYLPFDLDRKVTACYLNSGYNSDIEHAKEFLTKDGVYTISMIIVDSFRTNLQLHEVPDQWFNSVHFDLHNEVEKCAFPNK